MTYQSISEQNRYLYGQLEENYWLINDCRAADPLADISELISRREHLKYMIDINLEKLETVFLVVERKRKSARITDTKIATGVELAIINTFKNNPDLTDLAIAKIHQVAKSKVYYTLRNFLSKQLV